jgi:uncharacterized membrane protein (DUF106 family)
MESVKEIEREFEKKWGYKMRESGPYKTLKMLEEERDWWIELKERLHNTQSNNMVHTRQKIIVKHKYISQVIQKLTTAIEAFDKEKRKKYYKAWELYHIAQPVTDVNRDREPLFTPDDFLFNKTIYIQMWKEYGSKFTGRNDFVAKILLDNEFANYLKYCVENLSL